MVCLDFSACLDGACLVLGEFSPSASVNLKVGQRLAIPGWPELCYVSPFFLQQAASLGLFLAGGGGSWRKQG